MTFPVVFHLAGHAVPAHLVFEVAAYTVGFQTFLVLRRRSPDDAPAKLPFEQMMWVLVGCVFGALFGSKTLAWLESFPEYWSVRHTPLLWLEGKTIVGGLLGGWIGVEIAKRILRIRTSTGDPFAVPLCLGIAIGRIGCFLTGLPDHTHGVATNLPWGVDFGDGVRRHPTQLYESAFLLLLAAVLSVRSRRAHPNGEIFRLFMLAYLSWRFCVEFIKPTWKPIGMSPIQLTSAAGAAVAAYQLRRLRRARSPGSTPPITSVGEGARTDERTESARAPVPAG